MQHKNVLKHFQHLTDEQKQRIIEIWDERYTPQLKGSMFDALGFIAAYVISGGEGNKPDPVDGLPDVVEG